jgi:hypothetical protein
MMVNSYKARLWVNDKPIELNPFVEEFVAHVSIGAVLSLKGVDAIHSVEICQKQADIEIKVDGNPIPLIAFPVKIIANTLDGLVSTLKGVDKINTLLITVQVN